MQLMALLKELICGSYSGSLQANVHSESRDLLDRTEQSNRRQKLRRCWGKPMNTAIGACMETGMAGYIAIITGRIPAMAYC